MKDATEVLMGNESDEPSLGYIIRAWCSLAEALGSGLARAGDYV